MGDVLVNLGVFSLCITVSWDVVKKENSPDVTNTVLLNAPFLELWKFWWPTCPLIIFLSF